MIIFIAGLVLFFGSHSLAMLAPRWRAAQIARRGTGTWKGIVAIVSLIGLVLLVIGYGSARQTTGVLYVPPVFLRHLALLLMVPVFPLLFAAYLPGRIARATRHPMLLAVKIWATAHLLANGGVADVVLFGAFLAWAVADRISLKRRPTVPAHDKPAAPPRAANDLIAIVGGLLVYGAFIGGLHLWLIGVSPLPMRS